jgi:GT2 family glycosyltransferase
MASEVDVVVVAYGSADLLDACLTALRGESPVIVVDNSSDPAVHAVTDGHRARYVDAKRNLGFAAGVNLGLDHLPQPLNDVLLLNPDAAIDHAGVVELQRFLHDHPDLAGVAPAQIDPSEGSEARVGWPFPTPLGAWLEALGLGRLRRQDEFMIGSVLLLRASALTDVGRFDEQFFLYAEETDWQRRARDRGWRMALCTDVVATHIGAGTGGDVSERETHFHASLERYLRKHHGASGWRIFRAGVMAGSLLRALVLPGERGRLAAARLHLYRTGPCRAESRLTESPMGAAHQS